MTEKTQRRYVLENREHGVDMEGSHRFLCSEHGEPGTRLRVELAAKPLGRTAAERGRLHGLGPRRGRREPH
jgi:hypothetical protein